MTYKEFKQMLVRAEKVAIVTLARDPVLITKNEALKIVRTIHGDKRQLQYHNFSGRIFIAKFELDDVGSYGVFIGLPSDFEEAVEVTP